MMCILQWTNGVHVIIGFEEIAIPFLACDPFGWNDYSFMDVLVALVLSGVYEYRWLEIALLACTILPCRMYEMILIYSNDMFDDYCCTVVLLPSQCLKLVKFT